MVIGSEQDTVEPCGWDRHAPSRRWVAMAAAYIALE
jgi:hypothetical protein